MSEKNNPPAAPSIEELLAKIEALEAISLDQQEKIELLTAENEDLKKAREAVSSVTVQKRPAPKKLVPEKVFKVGTKSFQFAVAQFRIDGVIIKAVDALGDPALLKEIVEKYSPLVTSVK
jgi:hypothetical protein